MTLSNRIDRTATSQRDLIDRSTLRGSAALLAGGVLSYVVMGQLHTGGPANHHEEVFGAYAGSDTWTAVHLGQFASMAVVVASRAPSAKAR